MLIYLIEINKRILALFDLGVDLFAHIQLRVISPTSILAA